MEKYETFMSRHGEQGVQAILENWERFCGIAYKHPVALEKRWEVFIRETASPVRVAA